MARSFPASLGAPAAPKSAQQIATDLRYAIASGRFQPHEHLIEESLAAEFATNRAVVRSALAILEGEGLVVRERNRGVRVRAVLPEEATGLLDVRAVLEGLIARHAALRVTDTGLRGLARIVARMRKCAQAEDFRGYTQANAEFHDAIGAIAQHAAATKALQTVQAQSLRFQFRSVVYTGRIAQSLAEHEALLRALKARDPEAAERAGRRHVEHIGDVLRHIGQIEQLA
jgi:DNA-binding GntR family transcriptional regulator